MSDNDDVLDLIPDWLVEHDTKTDRYQRSEAARSRRTVAKAAKESHQRKEDRDAIRRVRAKRRAARQQKEKEALARFLEGYTTPAE